MATTADILAAIADADSANVQPSQMVKLLDRAIAAAMTGGAVGAGVGELAAVSYTINGRSRTISLTDARELRKYYASIGDTGGILGQDVEFSS